MSKEIENLVTRLSRLRFELQDGGRARRHRYKIFDRETGKILAKFDELIYAETALKQYQERHAQELENELSRVPVPAA